MKITTNLTSFGRSVPYNRRAFALGTQMIIWRLLGAIPGPMIFGLFIDSSCVLWSHTNNECGDNSDNSGSCLIYNNYSFSRYSLHLYEKLYKVNKLALFTLLY
jgi:hypothetical protein